MPLPNCSALDVRVQNEWRALPLPCDGSCGGVSRVAVVISGQIRTLNLAKSEGYPREWQKPTRCGYLPPDRAVDQSIANSLRNRLFPSLPAFDVFAVLEAITRKQFDRACRSLAPGGEANLTCHLVPTVTAESAKPLSAVYRNFSFGRHKARRAAFGVAMSLEKQLKAHSLIAEAERRRGSAYSHIVSLRPDLLLVAPFPEISRLDFGPADRPGRVFFPGSNCIGGHEDWLAVGRAASMVLYLRRGEALQRDVVPGFGQLGWGAEEWVHHVVRQAGGETQAHPGIDACLVRPVTEEEKTRTRFKALQHEDHVMAATVSAADTAASSDCGPGAVPAAMLIWQGAEPASKKAKEKAQSTMLGPVVRTLVAGARQVVPRGRLSVESGGGVGQKLLTAVARLRAGDVFVWVGIFRLEKATGDICGEDCGRTVLRSLSQRGVYTIFYSSDAVLLHGHFCAVNNQLEVREVWEYSYSTIAYCARSGLNHTTRHVPPGYVGGSGTIADESHSSRRLVFLGALTPQRRACVQQLEASMRRLSPASSGLAAGDVVLPVEHSWTDASLDELLESHAYFVNIHK
eukprot:2773627-Prymnesium_polylepis.1